MKNIHSLMDLSLAYEEPFRRKRYTPMLGIRADAVITTYGAKASVSAMQESVKRPVNDMIKARNG